MTRTSTEEISGNRNNPKRHRSASTAELYAVLEALLPFATVEIDLLAEFIRSFPEDKDHAVDTERARLGEEAIATAKRLIGRKSVNIRRKQRALARKLGTENA